MNIDHSLDLESVISTLRMQDALMGSLDENKLNCVKV